MKRLCKHVDIEKLENQYQKIIENRDSPQDKPEYVLKEQVNDDKKTFFLQSGNMLIDYDDNLIDTDMRPGIPGLWSASERWIYR